MRDNRVKKIDFTDKSFRYSHNTARERLYTRCKTTKTSQNNTLKSYHNCLTYLLHSSYKWRVTKMELRKSGELREKSGELRIATPTFRNSPLIFKFMNGELQEVLTIQF